MLNKLLGVFIKRISHVLLGCNRFNELILHLLDEFDCILAHKSKRTHHRAVFNWPCWTDEGDEVGHIWYGDPKVRFWADLPFLSQLDTILSNDREAGSVGYIEASCADNSIYFLFVAFGINDRIFRNLIDCGEMNIDVWLLDRSHIWITCNCQILSIRIYANIPHLGLCVDTRLEMRV
jgi:hypothetical protein